MTRKLNVVLLVFLLLVGVPFYWLLLDTSAGNHALKPVTIEQLRTLSASMTGKGPESVRYEIVARRGISGNLLAAGSGLRPVRFETRAYQLVYGDGTWITIDRGIDSRSARERHTAHFDPIAQSAVDRAVSGASLRLLHANRTLHQATGQPGGAAKAIVARAANGQRAGPFAVAPGVVLIPADSVEPGESLYYVRRADGREMLFAGDIAVISDAWLGLRPPARIVTSALAPRNREEIAAWLRTIQALKQSAPKLEVITGHGANVPSGLEHGFVFPGLSHAKSAHKRLALLTMIG